MLRTSTLWRKMCHLSIKCREWGLRLAHTLQYFCDDPTSELLKHLPRTRVCDIPRFNADSASPPPPSGILILIPFKDRWALTESCLNSIFRQKFPSERIFIGLIDHASIEASTHVGIEWARKEATRRGFRLDCLRLEGTFNFSRLNNAAAEYWFREEFEWILLLNNDVVLDNVSSLSALANTGIRCGAGAVGATLLYPNRRIQHLFAVPGMKIIAAHPYRGQRFNAHWEWFLTPRLVPAATGALLLVRSEAWRGVGGLDENLPTLGQDIDLCLRLHERGWPTWVASDIIATHYEGASRPGKFPREEVEYFYRRWESLFVKGHPLWGTWFSRWSETPVRSRGEGPYPWWRLI
jgi:GT2 family glycosyltransferase